MLESLLFIILTFVGGIFLVISLITLLIGLGKKSQKLKKIALGIGVVPIFCFGLIAFWYLIAVPSFNKSQMEDFTGTYRPHVSALELLKTNGLDTDQIYLLLNSDGTYEFNKIEGVGLDKKGTWKTGGIDGMFEFNNQNGSLTDWGSPSGSGEKAALSFEFRLDKDDRMKTRRLVFVKK